MYKYIFIDLNNETIGYMYITELEIPHFVLVSKYIYKYVKTFTKYYYTPINFSVTFKSILNGGK